MITNAAQVCIAVTTILSVVASAFVALRFYCRLRIQKIKLGADDYTILIALVSLVVVSKTLVYRS